MQFFHAKTPTKRILYPRLQHRSVWFVQICRRTIHRHRNNMIHILHHKTIRLATQVYTMEANLPTFPGIKQKEQFTAFSVHTYHMHFTHIFQRLQCSMNIQHGRKFQQKIAATAEQVRKHSGNTRRTIFQQYGFSAGSVTACWIHKNKIGTTGFLQIFLATDTADFRMSKT